MKNIISIVLATVLSFAAFGSMAQSENLINDTCTLRANIASMIVGQKSRGASLAALKNSFGSWLASGMSGATDLQRAQIADWFNTWTGPVFEKWFETMYTKYEVDWEAAHKAEREACLANGNAAPVDAGAGK